MNKNTLIQLTQYGMGTGNEELGLILVVNYFKLLMAEEQLPKIIVFYNEGVRLLSKDSSTFQIFKDLESKGVQLLACKTCIDFFNLKDKVQVGIVGSMSDIVQLQMKIDKIINL